MWFNQPFELQIHKKAGIPSPKTYLRPEHLKNYFEKNHRTTLLSHKMFKNDHIMWLQKGQNFDKKIPIFEGIYQLFQLNVELSP